MTAAKKLQQEPGLHELLFHEANDAIMIVDCDTGKVTQANRRMQDLTGYLRNEIEAHPAEQMAPDAAQRENLRSTPFSRQLVGQSGFYEDIALRKKDGFLAFATLSVKTLPGTRTGGANLAFCILHDMGEKKSMERDLIAKHWELKNAYSELERAHMELKGAQEALVQAGKLAALGELAAGVAHELNQPLSGVLGFAQELEKHLKTNGNAATSFDYINEILKNGTRIKKIVQQLREFTRRDVEDLREVEVLDVIHESLKLLEQQFRSRGIDVSIKSDPSIPRIYCNPFQLEQVFINLATNARDAIEATGRGSGEVKIQVEWKKDKKFIDVIFSDDGIGMNHEAKNKAFEPFFTTKEVGKGTGLGLSVSYGIVAKIHGSITIESTPGKGAKFRITLPVDFRNLNAPAKKEN